MWTYPTVVLGIDATSMPSGPGGKDLFRCEPSPVPPLRDRMANLRRPACCLRMEHKRIQYSFVQSLHFGAAIGIAPALQ
jgi:hypothetical protein